jgi:hypothetical protein
VNNLSGDVFITGTGLTTVSVNVGQNTIYVATDFTNFVTTGSADTRYMPLGSSGNFVTQALTTGTADTRYMPLGSSGSFYASNNPAGYLTTGEGQNLFLTTGEAGLRYMPLTSSGDFVNLTTTDNRYVDRTNNQDVTGIKKFKSNLEASNLYSSGELYSRSGYFAPNILTESRAGVYTPIMIPNYAFGNTYHLVSTDRELRFQLISNGGAEYHTLGYGGRITGDGAVANTIQGQFSRHSRIAFDNNGITFLINTGSANTGAAADQDITNRIASVLNINPSGCIGIGGAVPNLVSNPTLRMVIAGGGIGPATDVIYNLGSSSLYWNAAYSQYLYSSALYNKGSLVKAVNLDTYKLTDSVCDKIDWGTSLLISPSSAKTLDWDNCQLFGRISTLYPTLDWDLKRLNCNSKDWSVISGNLLLSQQIIISGGFPAAGKILMSDSTGLGFWGFDTFTATSGDNRYVDRTNNQIITGLKTFLEDISTPYVKNFPDPKYTSAYDTSDKYLSGLNGNIIYSHNSGFGGIVSVANNNSDVLIFAGSGKKAVDEGMFTTGLGAWTAAAYGGGSQPNSIWDSTGNAFLIRFTGTTDGNTQIRNNTGFPTASGDCFQFTFRAKSSIPSFVFNQVILTQTLPPYGVTTAFANSLTISNQWQEYTFLGSAVFEGGNPDCQMLIQVNSSQTGLVYLDNIHLYKINKDSAKLIIEKGGDVIVSGGNLDVSGIIYAGNALHTKSIYPSGASTNIGTTAIPFTNMSASTFYAGDIYNFAGNRSIDIANYQLGVGSYTRANWDSCLLNDGAGVLSANWNRRFLYSSGIGTYPVLDWDTRTLNARAGNWRVISGNLVIGEQLIISGGTPGLNKVLTCDATGLASWQTPSASAGGNAYAYGTSGKMAYFTGSNVLANSTIFQLDHASGRKVGIGDVPLRFIDLDISGRASTQSDSPTLGLRVDGFSNITLYAANHSNNYLTFDCYYHSGWKSSVASSAWVSTLQTSTTAWTFNNAVGAGAGAAQTLYAPLKWDFANYTWNFTGKMGVGLTSSSFLPSGRLHVNQFETGIPVETISARPYGLNSGNIANLPQQHTYINSIRTTDASAQSIQGFPLQTGIYLIESRVVAYHGGVSPRASGGGVGYIIRGTYLRTGNLVELIPNDIQFRNSSKVGAPFEDKFYDAYVPNDSSQPNNVSTYNWNAGLVINGTQVILQCSGSAGIDILWSAVTTVFYATT